jgi:ribosomal protein S18 acetylase RimI-like enzyme
MNQVRPNDQVAVNMSEVADLADPVLDSVLDIYQDSFPLSEQMRISFFTRLLRKADRTDEDGRLFAAMDGDKPIGMLFYQLGSSDDGVGPVCYLWYLAVHSEYRNQRIGKKMYDWLVERVFAQGCRAMVWEVEIPEHSHEPDFARRRVAWYQRCGGRKLTGVQYEQSVGWQPPVPMDVMIHPNGEVTPEEAFQLCNIALDDSVSQIEELGLE